MTDLKLAKRKRNIEIDRLKDIYEYGKNNIQDQYYTTNFIARSSFAESIFDEFQRHHNDVISLIDDKEYDAEDKIRKKVDIYRNCIKAIVLDVEETIARTAAAAAAANASLTMPNVSVSQQIPVSSLSNVRLPKINVPIFDGNPSDWPSFFDLFKNIIHTCNTLTDVEKFQYLITLVRGEPLNLIKMIPITATNYIIAYNTLQERYEDRRALSTAYFNAIYHYPSITKANPQNLRHLIDTFSENLSALEGLNFNTKEWDFLMLNILLNKLDQKNRTDFELEHSHIVMPTYVQLVTYLQNRCKAFKSAENRSSLTSLPESSKVNFPPKKRNSPMSFMTVAETKQNAVLKKCPCCGSTQHLLFQCQDFLDKLPIDRFHNAKQHKLCINCLRGTHSVKQCISTNRCKKCNANHHTLLHFESGNNKSTNNNKSQTHKAESASVSLSSTDIDQSQVALITPIASQSNSTILLSTAEVEVQDCRGNFQIIRVLLDTASMANFITEKCAQRLGLKRFKSSTTIEGLNYEVSNIDKGSIQCNIRPRNNLDLSFSINAIVLEKICSDLPKAHIEISKLNYLSSLKMADSKFYRPGPIDMLIGAEIFPQILLSNRVVGAKDQPIALESIFGWILQGRAECSSSFNFRNASTSLIACTDENNSYQYLLERFWSVESVPVTSIIHNKQDDQCENHYVKNTFRLEQGNFVVSLPFKIDQPNFGNTYSQALRRFLYLENKFKANQQFYELYSKFIREFISKNYVSLVPAEDYASLTSFYLPHHGILKPDSTTMKLRVVFDASSKGSKNLSLNDALFPGPILHQSLIKILLNFRTYKFVFCCDITQMYCQIFVSLKDRKYQRFIWRFSDKDPLQEFEINRVTFGITSAPFLALRTLKELAIREKKNYPLGAEVLNNSVYVDDCVCGADSLDAALLLQQEVIKILNSGGFQLAKWSSNNVHILDAVSSNENQASLSFDKEEPSFVKVLGLQWNPRDDSFNYSFSPRDVPCTKRNILSQIARIFDPLGFIAPTIFLAKHLLQQLWLCKCNWDEVPSKNIIDSWEKFRSQLPEISLIKISRLLSSHNWTNIDLHGFCDASIMGYGGVIYLRYYNDREVLSVRLIHGKSKVAPLKSLCIPRLELCAALLLSELIENVYNMYKDRLNFTKIFAWSDSQVTLSWIKSSPHKWKTFVANRVSAIQEKIPEKVWSYIPSALNPADSLSRGLYPHDLCNNDLWWSGPKFLYLSPENWPQSEASILNIDSETENEHKKVVLNVAISPPSFIHELLNHFSSLQKILHIIAYMMRFITNSRVDKVDKIHNVLLQPEEISGALTLILKDIQSEIFTDEISALQNGRSSTKQFKKLAVFIDNSGVLRVGGRLRCSDLEFDAKHPVLLPKLHRFTDLVIEQIHNQYCHPGLKTMQNLLLQNYWVLSPRKAIYRCLSKCIQCFRANPRSPNPYMSDLPSFRISQVKAFSKIAIDYAGPYKISMGRYRGVKTSKAYVFVFVCCATKAVHIELSSDLTSETCIASFRRFIARRGRITDIYSDQGTNFKGAYHQLIDLAKQSAQNLEIKWHFNPPSAPHFNGLAEAGVKSIKTHLERVIGEQILTFEEFLTLLTQIESILNSRPLTPMSSDPNDLQSLTPNHFLNLEPVSKLPDPHTPKNLSCSTRWNLIQHMQANFWKRWKEEYLHTLQQRLKWLKDCPNVKVGSLVLIKNEVKPPLQWVLGRIQSLHPGKDGIVRVVTLKTDNGILQRPVVKLCPLPVYD